MYFYQKIKGWIPNGYSFGPMNNLTNQNIVGTLLDYSYSMNTMSIQIGMGSQPIVPSNQVLDQAMLYHDFVINSLLEDIFNLDIDYDETEQIILSDTLNNSYYSTIEFSFELTNSKALDYNFTFVFDPGFHEPSGYILNAVLSEVSSSYSDSVTSYIINITNSIYTNITANLIAYGYATTEITIQYYRINSSYSDDYSLNAQFLNGYYNKTITKSGELNSSSGSSSNDKQKAMIVGLILLIVLLVLLLIAGIVLFCKRKRLHENPPNFFPNANVAEPPNPNYA